MYPLTTKQFGHVIEELDENSVRVTKYNHTYYLEGAAAQAWKDSYSKAEKTDLVSRFLDWAMVDLGHLPL